MFLLLCHYCVLIIVCLLLCSYYCVFIIVFLLLCSYYCVLVIVCLLLCSYYCFLIIVFLLLCPCYCVLIIVSLSLCPYHCALIIVFYYQLSETMQRLQTVTFLCYPICPLTYVLARRRFSLIRHRLRDIIDHWRFLSPAIQRDYIHSLSSG